MANTGFSFEVEEVAADTVGQDHDGDKESLHTLFALVYQEGPNPRWGRRSTLDWDQAVRKIEEAEETTVHESRPVATVMHNLPLPEGCQNDLARYLEALAHDSRKQSDVRDMCQVALADPSAASKLEVAKHVGCGIVQFRVLLTFRAGRLKDWFSKAEPELVSEAIKQILHELDVPVSSIAVAYELASDRGRWSGTGSFMMWLVVVRTSNATQSQALKRMLEDMDFCTNLQVRVPLDSVLHDDELSVEYHGDAERLSPVSNTFQFQFKDLRVIGGKILDIIDPCRASIDPSLPSSMSSLSVPIPNSTVLAPSWVSSLVFADKDSICDLTGTASEEPAKLHFASEVSGIPWMGSHTLASPLYQRLGQVLTAMQGLFAKIQHPIDAGATHSAKVIVKAQMYSLRAGEEILGQLHQEGVEADKIATVGLYYPVVDDALTGGDLEITVVMRGGCGSKFPVSKSISIAAGTAVAFENITAYHRMTSLSCELPEGGGQRMVLAFFVLRPEGHGNESPSSDVVSVNFQDKARAMVRLVEYAAKQKLPRNAYATIVDFLAGDEEYLRQQFASSRGARSVQVTHEGLTLQTCD